MTKSAETRWLNLRCGPAYRHWVAELAELVGRSTTDLIDAGLREIARQEGFRSPPRRCYPAARINDPTAVQHRSSPSST
jgi:hypothetical protein